MIAAAKAGPQPIHNKLLTADILADAIQNCLTPQALQAAEKISQRMKVEQGVKKARQSFYDNLPVEVMRCDLLPDQPAVWRYTRPKISLKLSDKAAFILTEQKRLETKHLSL